MYGQPAWTDFDEAGDYVVPNVLSPRDLVFRTDNMDETVPHIIIVKIYVGIVICHFSPICNSVMALE